MQVNLKKSLDLELKKKKKSDYLAGLRLTLSYIGLGFEKYFKCLSGFGFISGYIGFGLKKCSDYLTGVRLILRKLGIKNTWTTLLDSDLD